MRGVAAIWSPSFQHNARVSNKLFHITDWLPTLYAAAGGNLNDLGPIDGINQWQLLSSSHGPGRDRLLININEVSRTEGAIIGDYKFIRGKNHQLLIDLYHYWWLCCHSLEWVNIFGYFFLKCNMLRET